MRGRIALNKSSVKIWVDQTLIPCYASLCPTCGNQVSHVETFRHPRRIETQASTKCKPHAEPYIKAKP